MTTTIVISGATSAMAQAFARLYAARGAQFFLMARNTEKLAIVRQDLQARGAGKVIAIGVDMSQPQDYTALVLQAIRELGHIDIALIAQGVMYPQAEAQRDARQVRDSYQVNVLSAIETANAVGEHFEQQGKGSLLVISSVAGDRGRQSNYIYGSTKAALSVFTDGLRHRLGRKGITVITVKPGFVDTPMAAGLDTGGPLWATPEVVAADMARAIEKRAAVLYTPWFWRYIMLVIRHIPEFIFRKMSL